MIKTFLIPELLNQFFSYIFFFKKKKTRNTSKPSMLKYIGIEQFRGKLSITPSRFNKRERDRHNKEEEESQEKQDSSRM